MTEKRALQKIFELNNTDLAEQLGESYSYAGYIRSRYNATGLTFKLKAKLFKAFDYEVYVKKINN